MNNDLINIYIETLLNEITELVKTKLLIETKLKYAENLNKSISDENESLKAEIEKLNKRKPKSVNTDF